MSNVALVKYTSVYTITHVDESNLYVTFASSRNQKKSCVVLVCLHERQRDSVYVCANHASNGRRACAIFIDTP